MLQLLIEAWTPAPDFGMVNLNVTSVKVHGVAAAIILELCIFDVVLVVKQDISI